MTEYESDKLAAPRGILYGLTLMLPVWLVVCALVVGVMEWLK
jgi:hypothetical protein